MTNPTPSTGGPAGESTSKTDLAQRGARHTLRTIAIILVAALVLVGGGWWANQAGLLSRWLAPAAQTASSVAAGVQAQTGQTDQTGQTGGSTDSSGVQATGVQTSTVPSGRGQFPPNGQPPADGQFPPGGPPPSGPQAGGVLTGTVPSGAGAPTGFGPTDQTPPQETGSAAADAASSDAAGSVDAVSEDAAATANSDAASTAADAGTDTSTGSSAGSSTVLSLATVPAVAGVKGSQLYDGSGSLLGSLEAGDSVLVTGRSDDSAWLAVTSGAGIGWVQADQLIAYGLYRLPVVTLPTAVAAVAGSAATAVAPVTVTQAVSLTVAASVSATSAVTGAVASAADSAVASPASSADAVTATVVTDDGRLNLRAGPGTDYTIVAKGENGDVYPVLGRNEAGDWLQLQLEDGETAWASAAFLQIAGDVSALPLQAVPAPTAQASTAQPAANTAAGSIAASGSAADEDAVSLVSNTNAAGSGSASAAGGGLTGTLVFQQSPGGMIYAYDLAGGDVWPLTNGFDPAISPDGSTVAFVRDGGETGLYLINIDGSNERRIFERAALSSPKWSPDGQWIVFTRNDEGVECYQMGPKMCILPEEAKKRFPMGVPDTMPLVTEYQYKLSAVDLNGDNYHDVPSLNSARAADWSDAGIVYQSSAGIQITADAEDATTTEVAFDNLNPYYYDPDLQPGGGTVVFQREGAAQTDLWAVNTDGSGLHALTKPKTTLVDTLPSNVAAAYSPDGQHIVFLSNRTDSGEAGDWHLWVMNADGSDQRQLPVEVQIDYTYGDDQVVSWGA